MRKLGFVLLISVLSSCAKPYNGPILKGSDYVSMNPGTTYHYKRVATKTHREILLDITINNCNKSKTQCEYTTKVRNSSGKLIEKYTMDYKIKDGAVDMVDNLYKKGTVLLPNKLELDKIVSLNDYEKYGSIEEKLVLRKIVPEIKANNKTYRNCINIVFETLTPLKQKQLKVITNEIACKNIGTVKKELGIYYRLITDNYVNDNKFIKIDTYVDTLQSISHGKAV